MRRRTFTSILCWLAALGLARTGGAQLPAAGGAAPATTTVIVVRHAEKAAQPAADPPLTEGGRARARALAAALVHAGVTAVITTQYERTRDTGAPTAAEFHLTPEVVPASAPVAGHARAVATAVMQHAGGTVLVVGHSNTVAEIVAALGATQPPDLCDAEYDAMFVVTIALGRPATVVKARYGAATPVPEGCGTTMK